LRGPEGKQGPAGPEGPQGYSLSATRDNTNKRVVIRQNQNGGSIIQAYLYDGEPGPAGEAGPAGATGEQGPKGDTGDSGVYVGTTEPGADIKVWINPEGEAVIPGGEGVKGISVRLY
jgi:hypothetical protein